MRYASGFFDARAPRRAVLEDDLPLPPPELVHAVAGTDDAAWFRSSGTLALRAIRSALSRHGRAIGDLGAVLDFGCGAGRVLRHWAGPGAPALHGTDSNPALIDWCEQSLPVARYQVNTQVPLLGYDDESFDLAYALSVFTHLPLAEQRGWMRELHRVLRPDGMLLLSTHGTFYLPHVLEEDRARFLAGEPIVYGAALAGSNTCVAFHPEAWVRSELARDFTVLEVVPEGALGNPRQDQFLLRKRPLA